MSESIKVKINPDGRTAKEINKFEKATADEIFSMGKEFGTWKKKKWQEAESKLRTFSIALISLNGKKSFKRMSEIKAGTIHSAEVLPNGKIKIL